MNNSECCSVEEHKKKRGEFSWPLIKQEKRKGKNTPLCQSAWDDEIQDPHAVASS